MTNRFDHETYKVNGVRKPWHDEDHSNIKLLDDEGVKIFLVGNIIPHAFRLINSLNLETELALGMITNNELEKLKRSELEILKAPTIKKSFS